ncbi:C2H2-type domain-containing protein [Favolaschia claudopus]|uniref:C2H2-type domain-containing protein n=1 Tax=Favolaschia claudopus TaxID=2862362 RepID=A0AAV9Z2C4_9AGAR
MSGSNARAPWYCSRCQGEDTTDVAYPDEKPQTFHRTLGKFSCKRCEFTPCEDPARLGDHVRLCRAPDPVLISQHRDPPSKPTEYLRQSTVDLTHPTSPIPGLGIRRPSFPITRTVHPPPRPNLANFPVIDPRNYLRIPEPSTITTHETIPLRSYSIIINTELGIIICVNCGKSVTPRGVVEHIRAHAGAVVDVPSNLGATLEETFSLTNWKDVAFPRGIRAPIYGLLIFPNAFFFCGRCGHGYSSESSLGTHQSSPECPRVDDEPNEHFLAYGQAFAFTTSKFAVDIEALTRRDTSSFDAAELYMTTFAPPPDYSRLPVSLPVNTQDLDQFFHCEGWIEHLAGMTPVAINALTSVPKDNEHAYISLLRDFIFGYFTEIGKFIKGHSSHGLMRKMAQVSDIDFDGELRCLNPKSYKDYGRELVRMLYNCIEQARGQAPREYYPLTPSQTTFLLELHGVLIKPRCSPENATPHIHRVLFELFTQLKEHGAVPNFDLTVISYLVARSMGESEWIRTSEIGRVVAKLMWSTRGVVLYELQTVMEEEKLSTADAYQRFKKFLTDGQDSVFTYLFNTATLLKSIRGEEYGEAHSFISDALGRELTFRGHPINLDGFLAVKNALAAEYDKIVKEEIFFNQQIPDWFKREFHISSFVDDVRNNTAGYSFIDHPQNGLTKYFTLYGEWLLSSPHRAAEFADFIGGEIVWKSAPCLALLKSFAKLRRILCTRKIIDVGPSVRATEIARDLLRNVSGASMRSLLILFHNMCIVGVQDKTSHRILKKRFTPGVEASDTAQVHLANLVFFRRFESDLIRFFRGDVDANRYNMYLWPDLKANLDGDTISEDLGDATEEYLGTRLQILEFRHVTSAFLRYHFQDEEDINSDRFYDLLSNHSTKTSEQRYGISRDTLANAPMHHIKGCLNATIKWQHLTHLDGGKPLTLQIGATMKVLIPELASEQRQFISTSELCTLLSFTTSY